MRFHNTTVDGAIIVEPEKLADDRGFFARTFCRREFARQGLEADFVQCNIARSHARGTLRALHTLKPPHIEAKLMRVSAGTAFIVVVDIRPDSSTYLQWTSLEATAENHLAMYVPAGCLSGYQTLAAETELFYLMGAFFQPTAGCGYRYDDPAFNVQWPLPVSSIAQKDLDWPPFTP